MGVRADPWNGGAEPPDKNAPPGPAGTAFSLAGIPVLRGFRPLGSSRLPPPLTARRLRWERSHCLPRPICAHKEKTNSSKVRYYPDLNLRSRGKPRGCAQVVESAPAVRDRRAQKRAPGGLARRGLSGQARALCGPAPAARRAPSPFVFNSSSSTASPRPPAIPTTARARFPRCSRLVSTRTLSLVPPLGCSRASRRPSARALRGSCCDCRSTSPAVNT